MDSQNWDKIQDLFHTCIELSLEEQKLFIERLKKNDSAIAGEVENLLNAHHSAGTFLDDEIADDMFIKPGEMVGPWQIIKEIGKGGMSSVYLASRADGQFERNVAIKFLHGLLPGKEMHRRLELERNILASLQHKNIAQLLDAGFTDAGRPYFILEYIDGKPITEWCDENQIPLPDRLVVFEQVCEAVQFAHQRLIVHRDLKPSNILVDQDGNVKLLDFGIAKILEEEPHDGVPLTRTGQLLMTPEYASPEQVQGKAITTATDVYALGLILCELLTGSLPYPVSGKNTLEIGSIISDTPPSKPSSMIGGASTLKLHSQDRQLSQTVTRRSRHYYPESSPKRS